MTKTVQSGTISITNEWGGWGNMEDFTQRFWPALSLENPSFCLAPGSMVPKHLRSALVTFGPANQRVHLEAEHLALFVKGQSSSHKEVFIHFHSEQNVIKRQTSYWSTYLAISFCLHHQYCTNIHPRMAWPKPQPLFCAPIGVQWYTILKSKINEWIWSFAV